MLIVKHYDSDRRRVLKMFSGVAAAGLLSGVPGLSAGSTGKATAESADDLINCTLISRADVQRDYLLMHNKSNAPVVVEKFGQQSLRFDETAINMADALAQPVVIPANDRVMVRLTGNSIPLTSRSLQTTVGEILDLSSRTKYLPQGTRVIELGVHVKNSVCTIAGSCLA